MIKSIISYIKDLFSGRYIDRQCEDYVSKHSPVSDDDADRLRKEFWRRKLPGTFL